MNWKCHQCLSALLSTSLVSMVCFHGSCGKSAESKSKPTFLEFCRLSSLPNRQTLLTHLCISSGWNDPLALCEFLLSHSHRGVESLNVEVAANPMCRLRPFMLGCIIQLHSVISGPPHPFFPPRTSELLILQSSTVLKRKKKTEN